jgi:hypothetical protein
MIACLIVGALAASPAGAAVNTLDTYPIAKVTGPGPLNFTAERWNFWGGDLGHMFEHEGRVYMVFGDWGAAAPLSLGFQVRSNAMAYFAAANPRIGPLFDGMITDRSGEAAELLPSRRDSYEQSLIPTYGVSVGNRMFLHYMSVHQFGEPGHWTLNSSGVAYSDDDGHTWVRDAHAVWAGDTNFGQVAITKVGDYAYFFGIPGGRFGAVKLARARTDRILRVDGYQYWDGQRFTSGTATSAPIIASSSRDLAAPSDAGSIVPPNVGELSVQWNSYYGRWLMMYSRLAPDGYAAVIRTASCLTGPWGPEQTVLTDHELPTLYAPYIAPRWNDGPDIFFSLSIYGSAALGFPVPYNVFWMHTSLTDAPSGTVQRCVSPAS